MSATEQHKTQRNEWETNNNEITSITKIKSQETSDKTRDKPMSSVNVEFITMLVLEWTS